MGQLEEVGPVQPLQIYPQIKPVAVPVEQVLYQQ